MKGRDPTLPQTSGARSLFCWFRWSRRDCGLSERFKNFRGHRLFASIEIQLGR